MKKIIKFLFLASIIGLNALSCKRDTESAEKFSTLSVEENKAIVEDSGIDLIGVLTRMRETQTVDAIGNMADLMENSGKKGISTFRNTKLYSVVMSFTDCSNGKGNIKNVFNAIISCKNDDPESIQEFWNDNVGTYTWNSGLSDWDTVYGGDKIIFKFPSSDVATSNDATFTIYNYDGVYINNPADDEYDGDLPVTLNADLKVGSTTLVTFTFGASYNNDGVPNAIAGDLDIENYKFEVDVTNNTQLISATYKFWEGSTVVMNLGAAVNGLFTDDNYDDNTVHHSEPYTYWDYVYNPNTQVYEWVEVTGYDEWDEVEFEEIANSANANFQILNIALRGDIDIKGLVDQIRIIDEDYENEEITEETADSRYAEQLNKYLNLRLVNVSNNEIIAKADAYVVHESDDWDEWTYVSFRLTFGDGSPIDMETYFDEGFDDFVDSLNHLLQDISDDYNLDIEPIDY